MNIDDIITSEAPLEGRVVIHNRGHLALIIIDRPRKLNGFTPEMLAQLSEAYTTLEQEPYYRCGVLLANGKNFTAGLQLDRLWSTFVAGKPLFPPGLIDPVSLRPPIRRKPLVCAVQGICFTLGIELMLASDVVVAAADCRFAQIEIRRGIMASEGATIRMVERAGWGNAQRYLLTGDEFDAEEARRLGFVQEVVPVGAAADRAIAIAETISEQAPLAIRASLSSSRQFLDAGFAAAARDLDAFQKELAQTDDAQEGLLSFRERRKAVFRGR